MRLNAKRLCLAVVAAAGLAGGCAVNPATGERNFNLVSEEQEVELGQTAEPEVVKQFGGIYPDPQVTAFVAGVGKKLAASSARPNLPWKFQVVNSPELNAFALPGGPIFITRGLLARLQNESQLAGVLGHEVGHVAARHQAQQISKSTALQAALGLGSAVAGEGTATTVGATGATIAGQLLLMKYGRDMESQADQLGVDYSVKTGYDPRGVSELLGILLAAEKESGGARPPEFLLTHPATERRVEEANEYIAKRYPNLPPNLTRDSEQFARVIAPMRSEAPSERTVPAGQPQPQPPAPQQKGFRRR